MDDYAKAIEYLKNSKPQGKAIYSVGGKLVEADYNFNPPRVRKIEVEVSYPTLEEIKEQEEEE